MFPDAVTERGRKHILELASMSEKGIRTGVLFLVHWDRARWFLPDYHTDPNFAEAFYEAAPHLDWKALALRWDSSFSRPEPVRLLTYPEAVLTAEIMTAATIFSSSKSQMTPILLLDRKG